MSSESNIAAASNDFVYGLYDKPPLLETLFVSVQHIFAIFAPIVAPGLIISGALGFEPEITSYIVGMSLLVSGIVTFIQALTVGPIGTELLSIQGTSFFFLSPLIAVGSGVVSGGGTSEEAMSLILELCFFGALIEIFIGRILHLAKQIFTPLITGIVVT